MAKRTPIKAIRAKCIDCCCGQIQEVQRCPAEDCPLYEYRLGKRPKNIEIANDFNTEEKESVILQMNIEKQKNA